MEMRGIQFQQTREFINNNYDKIGDQVLASLCTHR